jgi:hypothetical protein
MSLLAFTIIRELYAWSSKGNIYRKDGLWAIAKKNGEKLVAELTWVRRPRSHGLYQLANGKHNSMHHRRCDILELAVPYHWNTRPGRCTGGGRLTTCKHQSCCPGKSPRKMILWRPTRCRWWFYWAHRSSVFSLSWLWLLCPTWP